MRGFDLLMYALAIACFVLAALWPSEPEKNGRLRLVALGLVFVTLIPFVALFRSYY